jgi:signal transduction histidine kinase
MKRNPPYILVLISALLALLPLLAVFQYHWLGEVSKGEREKMKGNLQVSAAQFGQEFDREVKNAYIHFQAGPGPFGNQTDLEFVELYRRWQSTSVYPRLVHEVYQAAIGEDETYRLALFNPSRGKFERCPWPEKLEDFRKSIEQQRKAQGAAQTILRNVFKQSDEIRGQTFVTPLGNLSLKLVDGEIPGLIIPILPLPRALDSGNLSLPAVRSYRIVSFDLDYIKKDLLPELAKRHFTIDGKSDYNVAVVKQKDPKKVIYQSTADWPQNGPASGDVSYGFFSARISEGDRMLIAARLPEGMMKEDVKKEPKSGLRHLAIRVFQNSINILRQEGGAKPEDIASTTAKSTSEGLWQLVVKHRTGSLETAVAGARRRNLAISFGILLLLGVSVCLIVLSSRRAQRLANQQLEFVAGVSHELRTPLAVICSAAENLADGVIDNRDQMKRYGGLIRDEGRRLAEMVEQVLEFSGEQSGRRFYVLKQTELDRVIEDALAACHPQIVDRGFKIEKRISENLPVVNIDPAALSRAIQNLLGNAMKYSGESRWLGLVVESVKTGEREEVEIKISDQGVGIAPSDLPHIFEPFYRGNAALALQIHGTGLGLSLVKQIVESHGGRISVESKLKHGTTFTLKLPIIPPETSSTESTKESYEQAHFAR